MSLMSIHKHSFATTITARYFEFFVSLIMLTRWKIPDSALWLMMTFADKTIGIY